MLYQPRSVRRRGIVIVVTTLMIVVLLGMVAFAVDIGYIKWCRTELQAAADSAALAAASRLLDRDALKAAANMTQEHAAARDEAVRFAGLNKGGGLFLVLDRNDANNANGDVVIGYFADPSDHSTTIQLNSTQPANSVQVRVHRDNVRNGPLNMLFAPVLGTNTQNLSASATATFEGGIRGFRFPTGGGSNVSKLLPFALDINLWNDAIAGVGPDAYSYNPETQAVTSGTGDGIKEIKLFPWKNTAPGNFGTIDIGGANNSTSDLERQIRYGPNQADFNHYPGGKFELGANGTLVVGGDTGISAGMKDSVQAIIGQPRIIPLYLPPVTGTGNTAEFTIVGFAGIIITEVTLTGGDKEITIQPEWVIDAGAIGGDTSTRAGFIVKPLQLSR